MEKIVIAEVSFQEFHAASLKDPVSTPTEILMKLFEAKGIRMMNDHMQPTPPADVMTDLSNNRFFMRQEQ